MRFFSFERRWLLEVFTTILPSGQGAVLPLGARDVPLAGFVDDLLRYAPLRVALGLRLCLWFLVACPLFVIGKARTFLALSDSDRLAVLGKLRASPVYVVREIPLLFKMVGCLGFCGMPVVQERLSIEPRDQSLPPWASTDAERAP